MADLSLQPGRANAAVRAYRQGLWRGAGVVLCIQAMCVLAGAIYEGSGTAYVGAALLGVAGMFSHSRAERLRG